jgi:regulator of protease activity HflC (stomatin/prohibitin superfamily)
MTPGTIVLLGLILLAIIVLFKTATVVPQKSAYLVERLGKYANTLGAGFHLLVPFVDTIAYKQTLKEEARDVPPQNCITRDNVVITVDGILYMQVMDPVKASYGISDYRWATIQLARGTGKTRGDCPVRRRAAGAD